MVTDLYYKGANPFGLTSSNSNYLEFCETYLSWRTGQYGIIMVPNKEFNFANYNNFKIDFTTQPKSETANRYLVIDGTRRYMSPFINAVEGGRYTLAIPLTDKIRYTLTRIEMNSGNLHRWACDRITRIYFD